MWSAAEGRASRPELQVYVHVTSVGGHADAAWSRAGDALGLPAAELADSPHVLIGDVPAVVEHCTSAAIGTGSRTWGSPPTPSTSSRRSWLRWREVATKQALDSPGGRVPTVAPGDGRRGVSLAGGEERHALQRPRLRRDRQHRHRRLGDLPRRCLRHAARAARRRRHAAAAHGPAHVACRRAPIRPRRLCVRRLGVRRPVRPRGGLRPGRGDRHRRQATR